jgi:uncharacterized protein YmfQ (DUF2313 family)
LALSTQDYLQQLRGLLPKGPAWSRDPTSLLSRILTALAEELSRIDVRIENLIDEADPRTTLELTSDWEALCGLPDGCTGPLSGLAARRAAVVGRLTTIGGQSAAYYVALAQSLGYEITVTEEDVHTCMSDCMEPVNSEEWRFVWNVNVAEAETPRVLTCMDECTTPLRVWGNELLECTINRLKPAHTFVRFIYP